MELPWPHSKILADIEGALNAEIGAAKTLVLPRPLTIRSFPDRGGAAQTTVAGHQAWVWPPQLFGVCLDSREAPLSSAA